MASPANRNHYGDDERRDRDGGDAAASLTLIRVRLHLLRHRGHRLGQLGHAVVTLVAFDHPLGEERGHLGQGVGCLVDALRLPSEPPSAARARTTA